MKSIYNDRRNYMTRRLKEMGFGIAAEPVGAFYIFANAKGISKSSSDLAYEVLEKEGVAVSPGIDFGRNGEGYLRFSYLTSMKNIEDGLSRIEKFLKKKGRLS